MYHSVCWVVYITNAVNFKKYGAPKDKAKVISVSQESARQTSNEDHVVRVDSHTFRPHKPAGNGHELFTNSNYLQVSRQMMEVVPVTWFAKISQQDKPFHAIARDKDEFPTSKYCPHLS